MQASSLNSTTGLITTQRTIESTVLGARRRCGGAGRLVARRVFGQSGKDSRSGRRAVVWQPVQERVAQPQENQPDDLPAPGDHARRQRHRLALAGPLRPDARAAERRTARTQPRAAASTKRRSCPRSARPRLYRRPRPSLQRPPSSRFMRPWRTESAAPHETPAALRLCPGTPVAAGRRRPGPGAHGQQHARRHTGAANPASSRPCPRSCAATRCARWSGSRARP